MVGDLSTDRRLRVLHVGKYYWPFTGGIETNVRDLSEGMPKTLDVRVLAANHKKGFTEEVIRGISVVRSNRWFTFKSAPVCPGMAHQIREAKPDLVHLHLPNPGATLAFLASGVRAPLVLSYHSKVIRQKIGRRVFEPINQVLLRRAAAILVTSEDLLDGSSALQPHRDRCHVVPYGVSLSSLKRPDPEIVSQLRERFGPRMLLSVGRLVYYKGFEHLIAAMRHVDGHLVIAGDGPLLRKLQDSVRALGLGERVTLAGEILHTAPYYHAAQIFVLASTHEAEAFGIVQLEAMACGKPVVNTSMPGVARVSLDGVTGITTPPGDSAAMAAALNRLLDDAVLRARYGAAGIERVQSEYGLERVVERVLQIYSSVLRQDQVSAVASARSFATTRSNENRAR